jgi:hypothetical protein
MIRRNFIFVLLLLLSAVTLKAQSIKPTDLFQIYKYWQMDVKGYDKNTYDYIKTIDAHWGLRLDPQIDANGLMLLMGYYKDNAWYNDEECRIMLSFDKTQRSPKSVMYVFADSETWTIYNAQMITMNAVKILSQQIQGGQQSVFQINGIVIYLTDYPPGINGKDRTYQVLISQLP